MFDHLISRSVFSDVVGCTELEVGAPFGFRDRIAGLHAERDHKVAEYRPREDVLGHRTGAFVLVHSGSSDGDRSESTRVSIGQRA